MRDILNDVAGWLERGEPVALATVVQTWGSSPRREGAKMALTMDGKIAGSVSGGCVEAAVFDAGVETLSTGQPQLLKFGVADETAWQVGLACGGKLEVFVQPLSAPFFWQLMAELEAQRRFAVASVVNGPDAYLGREQLIRETAGPEPEREGLDRLIAEKGRAALQSGKNQRLWIEWEQETMQVFVEVIQPSPKLVIVGGVHIAIALAAIAKTLGYMTIVVDPRRGFGNANRFPHVDRLIQAWPEEAFAQIGINPATAIAMLTHDPKIDDPALKIALDSQAFYVGALGSKQTQAQRLKRLQAGGLSAGQLDRLHGPIGLPIGAEAPEEIALAIMAEVVAARRGFTGPDGPRVLATEASQKARNAEPQSV